MEFQHEQDRIFALAPSGALLAEVTFPITENTATIDHTFVDNSLRGQGVANQLLLETANQLRAAGFKANPTCSYAIRWFEENPDYSDLL